MTEEKEWYLLTTFPSQEQWFTYFAKQGLKLTYIVPLLH